MEVIGFRVYSEEDNSIVCSKGEDGGRGESLVRQVRMLCHRLAVVGARAFFTEVRVFKGVSVSDMDGVL